MAHLTNFSFEFRYEIFTEDASLLRLYHGAKRSKMAKNSNQGGFCLNYIAVWFFFTLLRKHVRRVSTRMELGPRWFVLSDQSERCICTVTTVVPLANHTRDLLRGGEIMQDNIWGVSGWNSDEKWKQLRRRTSMGRCVDWVHGTYYTWYYTWFYTWYYTWGVALEQQPCEWLVY